MSWWQFLKEYSLRNRRPSKNKDQIGIKIAIKKRVINVGIFSNTRRNEYWFQNVTWEYYVGGKMVVRGKKPYTSERC